MSSEQKLLFHLAIGSQGRIRHVGLSGAVRQRLLDLGLVPGASVSALRRAPLGEPLWVSVEGCEIALRRSEAEAISLESQGEDP